MSRIERLVQWSGFNKNLAAYALRTAVASCVALFIGWFLGLEHPQWAAMSVWAASQPQQKGMLIEKSLFRLLGTVIGTIVGVSILYLSSGNILFIAAALTIWITICTGAGNLFNGLFSYLTLLCGYTASLVALLEVTQGADIYALGIDRMLTVLLGVVTAMVVGTLFNQRSSEELLSSRVRLLTGSVLTLMSQAARAAVSAQQISELVKEAAAIEELLEPHAAGSVRSRRSSHSMRALIYANVALLTRLNGKSAMEELLPVETLLQRLAEVVEKNQGIKQEIKYIEEIRSVLPDHDIGAAFSDLHTALTERLRYKEQGRIQPVKLRHMVVLHRDWLAAKQAMFRTFVLLGLIGLAWVWSESAIGAFVMLGTSVMVTLFSTFESPASLMGRIFLWQIVGLVASLATQGLVWPMMGSELQCLLVMALFILPVVIPLSSTRLSMGAMDYVMIYLLLSHLQYPASFDLALELPLGLAAAAGPLTAYLAFLLIFPTNGIKRSARIKGAILADLNNIFVMNWDAKKAAFIQSRAQHRLLRLIQNDSRRQMLSASQIMGVVNIISTIQLVGRIRALMANNELTEIQQQRAEQALKQSISAILSHSGEQGHFERLLYGVESHREALITSVSTIVDKDKPGISSSSVELS